MFLAELDLNEFVGALRIFDGILRHDATVVFHFHVQIIVREHFIAEIENLRESASSQAMIYVVRHIGLEKASVDFIVDSAAAIDKAFRDVTHFRDMEVRRDRIAVRQDKTRERGGLSAQDFLQLG